MKPRTTLVSKNRSKSQNSEPLGSANFSQRERMRHRRLASTTIPIFMLFLLTLFPQAVTNKNSTLIFGLFIGLGVCICALLLNWRGLVRSAGILTLIVVYVWGTVTMLHYPGQLTMNELYLLDLTIIPDVLVLAFFSANALLPVACINVVQVWAVLTYGPHDSAIAHLLQTAPLQIFSHVYTLQLIIVVVLYLWVRSAERTLARAGRAEKMAARERKERERQQQELERKHQLDDGIQQILQTHVAVANGDLNARAPLHEDHDLWQVARTLNNLIARLQRQNHTIDELKQQMGVENDRTTGQIVKVEQSTSKIKKIEQSTGKMAKIEKATGKMAKVEKATDELPKYE